MEATGKGRFLERYRLALAWLRSVAIDPGGTRFEEYDGVLSRFAKEGGVSRAWSEREQYVFHDAFLAAAELIRAHDQFGRAPVSRGLETRLRRHVRGSAAEREETPGFDGSTEPRDIGFEISLGAWFDSVGIPPGFPADPDGDVEGVLEGCDLNAEAKRPQSEKGLAGAVAKAAEQLGRKAGKCKRLPVNLLAVSIGKIVRKGELILPAPSIVAAKRELELTIVGFAKRHEHLWQPSGLGGIHGVLFHLESPVHLTETDELYAATFHVLNPVKEYEGAPEGMTLGRLVARLGGTVRDTLF